MQVDRQWDVSRGGVDSYQQTHANAPPKVKQTVRSKISVYERGRERKEQRTALEKEVTRLQKSLTQELNLRNALNRGLHRALGSLPRIPNNLPVETRKLLFEVAVLEEEVVSIEKQVVSLREELRSRDHDGSSPPLLQLAHPASEIITGSKAVAKISTVLQIRELHAHHPSGSVARRPSDQRSPGDHHEGIILARSQGLIAGSAISNHESSLRRATVPAGANLRGEQGMIDITRSNLVAPHQHETCCQEVCSRRSSSDSELDLVDLQRPGKMGLTVQSRRVIRKEADAGRPNPTSNQSRQLKSKDPVVARMLSSIEATKSTLSNDIQNRSGSQGASHLQKRNPAGSNKLQLVSSRQNIITPRLRQQLHRTSDNSSSTVQGTSSKRTLIPSPTVLNQKHHGSTENRISASTLDHTNLGSSRRSTHGSQISPQIHYVKQPAIRTHAQIGNLPDPTSKKGGFQEVPQDLTFTTSSSHTQSRRRTADQNLCAPCASHGTLMVDLDHISVSNKLSEEVARLLDIIYGSMQAGPTTTSSLASESQGTFLTSS